MFLWRDDDNTSIGGGKRRRQCRRGRYGRVAKKKSRRARIAIENPARKSTVESERDATERAAGQTKLITFLGP